MKNSPLQLDRLFFTKIEVAAVPNADPSAPWEVQATTEVVSPKKDDGRRWVVTLRVSLGSKSEKPSGYRAALEIVGGFFVSNEWPEAKVESLVYANGSAVLYGAAREMVCHLTSRGPYDMIVLPTVSFTDTVPKAPAKANA
jgi:preprotein translocase subunit SecB